MTFKNKVIVKKSTVVVTVLVITALLIMVIINLFSNSGRTNEIPEWEEFYRLGVANYNNGSYQSAVTSFKIAIDIDNTRPEAYLLAADAYLQLNQVKKAREILKIGVDVTENEALSLKYDEVMAMPDPMEIEVPMPADEDTDSNSGDKVPEEEEPKEELKSSKLTDVF